MPHFLNWNLIASRVFRCFNMHIGPQNNLSKPLNNYVTETERAICSITLTALFDHA